MKAYRIRLAELARAKREDSLKRKEDRALAKTEETFRSTRQPEGYQTEIPSFPKKGKMLDREAIPEKDE